MGLRRVKRNGVIALGLFVVGSVLTAGLQFAFSVLLGGLLAIFNFSLVQASVGRLLAQTAARKSLLGGLGLVIGFVGRLVLISLALFAMIHFSFLDLFGGLLGLSIFVVSGMWEALLLATRREA